MFRSCFLALNRFLYTVLIIKITRTSWNGHSFLILSKNSSISKLKIHLYLNIHLNVECEQETEGNPSELVASNHQNQIKSSTSAATYTNRYSKPIDDYCNILVFLEVETEKITSILILRLMTVTNNG